MRSKVLSRDKGISNVIACFVEENERQSSPTIHIHRIQTRKNMTRTIVRWPINHHRSTSDSLSPLRIMQKCLGNFRDHGKFMLDLLTCVRIHCSFANGQNTRKPITKTIRWFPYGSDRRLCFLSARLPASSMTNREVLRNHM